jgi:predicted nucleotidyltransferase
MLLQDLYKRKLIHPPSWLPENTHYLTVMGSIAYGTNTDTSDFDVYGFAIPKKEDIFPHLKGEISGFGRQIQRFDQYQEHHIKDEDALGGRGREYDFTIFNIVRYFQLAMENNPNVLDSLFTPSDCVLHVSAVGTLVRDNRKLFLHKGCIPKLKGYAFSQLHKAASENREGKRAALVEKFGYDPKFLSHVVRLTLQAEQILINGDLDLRRDREQIKAVKRGDITLDEVKTWFNAKELYLQKLYEDSKLINNPDEPKIKQLLLDCLEHHFGNLEKCIVQQGKHEQAINDIRKLLDERGL